MRSWLLAALVAPGCGAPLVDFAAPAIARPYDPAECAREKPFGHGRDRAYERVRDRWSRHAHVTHDYDSALDARVILAVPQFHAAYVHAIALLDCLAPAEYAALLDADRADQERSVDVIVLLDSSRWEWNDLSSARSIWNVTLGDDQGRVIAPIERQPLDMKPETLNALFGDATPFTRGWRIRFPRTFPDGTPLIRPEARRLTLRLAGPLGADSVDWRSR